MAGPRRGVVTLGEGIDTSTAAGRLVCGRAWLDRGIRARPHPGAHPRRPESGKAQGTKLGRRQNRAAHRLGTCVGLTHTAAAFRLGVSVPTIKRWRRALRQRGSETLSVVA